MPARRENTRRVRWGACYFADSNTPKHEYSAPQDGTHICGILRPPSSSSGYTSISHEGSVSLLADAFRFYLHSAIPSKLHQHETRSRAEETKWSSPVYKKSKALRLQRKRGFASRRDPHPNSSHRVNQRHEPTRDSKSKRISSHANATEKDLNPTADVDWQHKFTKGQMKRLESIESLIEYKAAADDKLHRGGKGGKSPDAMLNEDLKSSSDHDHNPSAKIAASIAQSPDQETQITRKSHGLPCNTQTSTASLRQDLSYTSLLSQDSDR